MVTPTAAVLPNVISLLEQINTFPSICYAITDLEIFPPPSLLIKTTRSNCLHLAKTSNIPSVPYLRGTSAPQPYNLVYMYNNLVHGDLNYLSLPQDVTLVNYIHDIMPLDLASKKWQLL